MAEKLTDIELSSIHLQETRPRSLAKTPSTCSWQEDDVETAMGLVHVCVQGDRSKPAIFTYHDIGMNSVTCFQGFFNYEDMQPMLRHFCVYHVNAPGQQEGALPLPQGGMRHSESDKLLDYSGHSNGDSEPIVPAPKKRTSLGYTGDQKILENYHYPTLDHLAEMLLPVMQYYGVKTIIGFGVGAGANILSRFALFHPDRVEALVLINCNSRQAGWSEWGCQKWNMWYLKSGQVTAAVEDYLLWHWFGNRTRCSNHDLVTVYTDYMKSINPQNLGHFIESYVKRSDLGIAREMDLRKKAHTRTLGCPTMLVAGEYSPHLEETVHMNSRLDPTNSTWLKFECGGMVLEESPGKLSDAFRLFLQGMGYVPSDRRPQPPSEVPSLSKMNLLAGSHCSLAAKSSTVVAQHTTQASKGPTRRKQEGAGEVGTGKSEAVC